MAAGWNAPETYKQEVNCLASGWELEGQLSPRQKCWQRPLFLYWDFQPTEPEGGCHVCVSITWITLLALPWWFPKVPPHPNFGPNQNVSIWMACHGSCFRLSKSSQKKPSIWSQGVLSGPRPGSSSSWPWFTAWPCLVTSKPCTSTSHLQIVPGDPRQNTGSCWSWPALPERPQNTPSGQLETTLKHHPIALTNKTFKE